MKKTAALFLAIAAVAAAQSNPLWHEQKVKNYLPHMTWPEVQDLLSRTDMVIFPVASIEQHGPQLPIGTDYLAAVEQAKLIAQKTDVLVAPILLPGLSPYHMEFPGTITLSSDTVQRVFFEAAQSLIHHGFRRFLILNGHTGDQYISRYLADRINQDTEAIAVDLNDAAAPYYLEPWRPGINGPRQTRGRFDRHAWAWAKHPQDCIYFPSSGSAFERDSEQRDTARLFTGDAASGEGRRSGCEFRLPRRSAKADRHR